MLLLGCGSAFAAGVTGDWKIDGDIAGNALALTCSLKQEDAKLSGKCVNATNNINSPVTGKVDGKTVTFQFDFNYSGMAMTMSFTGSNDTDTSMKGSVEVMGAEGSFTGVKQVTAP
jgi:hypothetical protein